MTIKITFHCKELVGALPDGCCEAPEGTAAKDAVLAWSGQNEAQLNPGFFQWTFPIINSGGADWTTVLTDGDDVHIWNVVLGG